MQKIEDSGVEPGPKPHRDAIDNDSADEVCFFFSLDFKLKLKNKFLFSF